MRISDAIALGRTMIKPLAGVHISADKTHGCAWGMVWKSAGSAYDEMHVRAAYFRTTLSFKCVGLVIGSGMTLGLTERMNTLSMAIVHLFNDHVMTRKDWTLDQLIDWVRSVEPVDPEEKASEASVSNVPEEVHSAV